MANSYIFLKESLISLPFWVMILLNEICLSNNVGGIL